MLQIRKYYEKIKNGETIEYQISKSNEEYKWECIQEKTMIKFTDNEIAKKTVNKHFIKELLSIILILTSLIPFLIAVPFLINIEQKAGYYECMECGHRYVPKYKSVFMARHIGRKRKMICSCCNKKTWNKKVIRKSNFNIINVYFKSYNFPL